MRQVGSGRLIAVEASKPGQMTSKPAHGRRPQPGYRYGHPFRGRRWDARVQLAYAARRRWRPVAAGRRAHPVPQPGTTCAGCTQGSGDLAGGPSPADPRANRAMVSACWSVRTGSCRGPTGCAPSPSPPLQSAARRPHPTQAPWQGSARASRFRRFAWRSRSMKVFRQVASPCSLRRTTRLDDAGRVALGRLVRDFRQGPAHGCREERVGRYQLGRRLSATMREREIAVLRCCARCGCGHGWAWV
jgi:hypothetical protein